MYYQIINFETKELMNAIRRISDNAFIPMDEANTDYQAYLAWIAEGNTLEPAQEQT